MAKHPRKRHKKDKRRPVYAWPLAPEAFRQAVVRVTEAAGTPQPLLHSGWRPLSLCGAGGTRSWPSPWQTPQSYGPCWRYGNAFRRSGSGSAPSGVIMPWRASLGTTRSRRGSSRWEKPPGRLLTQSCVSPPQHLLMPRGISSLRRSVRRSRAGQRSTLIQGATKIRVNVYAKYENNTNGIIL